METNDYTSTASAAWVNEMLQDSKELAVVQLSAEGRINGWWGAARHVFGYRYREIAGQPFAALFLPQDRDAGIPALELALATQAGRSEDERWHVRKDGGAFWASGVLARHCDAGGRLLGFYLLVRDRTDMRIRQETLQNRIAALTEELARRDATHLTLVHELRNAIGPMLGASWLQRGTTDPAVQAHALEVMQQQLRLVKRLLDEACAGGAPAPVPSPLEVGPVVLQHALAAAVEAFRDEAQHRRQALQLFVPATPITIDADAERLQQMLFNLLSNAIKYTPDDGRVTVSLTTDGEVASITVEDTGIGIAAESIARVFELFTREPQARERAAEGLGIGLAVVKHLASLHGGSVEARSAGQDKGSQFTLRLPHRHAGALVPLPART